MALNFARNVNHIEPIVAIGFEFKSWNVVVFLPTPCLINWRFQLIICLLILLFWLGKMDALLFYWKLFSISSMKIRMNHVMIKWRWLADLFLSFLPFKYVHLMDQSLDLSLSFRLKCCIHCARASSSLSSCTHASIISWKVLCSNRICTKVFHLLSSVLCFLPLFIKFLNHRTCQLSFIFNSLSTHIHNHTLVFFIKNLTACVCVCVCVYISHKYGHTPEVALQSHTTVASPLFLTNVPSGSIHNISLSRPVKVGFSGFFSVVLLLVFFAILVAISFAF